jgi:hypothetical protein
MLSLKMWFGEKSLVMFWGKVIRGMGVRGIAVVPFFRGSLENINNYSINRWRFGRRPCDVFSKVCCTSVHLSVKASVEGFSTRMRSNTTST